MRQAKQLRHDEIADRLQEALT